MPKALEAKLKREAKAKHFGKKRTGAHVYGTLNRLHLLHHQKGKRKQ